MNKYVSAHINRLIRKLNVNELNNYRPEINIKPWGSLLKELQEGNRRKTWMEREPYAYWKGNPIVAETRMDLLKCNVSDKQDWNARVYAQVHHTHIFVFYHINYTIHIY